MDLQKGDLVTCEDKEFEVIEYTGLREKIKIKNENGAVWVNKSEVEKIYKFREGEECYYRTTFENYECTVEAVLTRREKPWYVVYVPNFGKYKLVMELQLLKRKNFEDLKENESFYLADGEKIGINKIVFDDNEGVYKYLIKREYGEIQLINKETLKEWI